MILLKSNYAEGIRVTGGHIKDFQHLSPFTRKFPNRYSRRKVKVTISRYYGYGPHYYVTIQEEDNPIWDGKEWRMCWDDKEGKGISDTDLYFGGDMDAKIRVEAYQEALGKANMLIKKYFANHKVEWEDYCKSYEQEGS
jgi:hypothetical protein